VVDLTKVKVSNEGSRIELSQKHKFSEVGTHFPVLRVASQREGDTETAFTRI